MAQPTPYVPQTSFSDHSAAEPDVPQSGTDMDAEFEAIRTTLGETLDNLALIQRDDGALANGIVTPESLSDEIRAGISRALPWETAVEQEPGDLVWYLSILYSANGPDGFTSTTNPTIDTGNWTEVLDMTATVPDIITQEAQDARDEAEQFALDAEASAEGIASLVASVTYLWAGTSTGVPNTIALAPVPVMASYQVGHKLRFLNGFTNGGAVTMDTANALGPRTIKKSIGGELVVLAPGDMVADTISEIEYISDAAGYQLLNPAVYSRGADVASAASINLNTTTGDYTMILGTTGISAITLAEGRERTVTFEGALLLTHGASLLLKNGGSNITTAAGDSAVFRGEASGVVRMVSYSRASGAQLAPLVYATVGEILASTADRIVKADILKSYLNTYQITMMTPVASTSGTNQDFTGIPSWVKRITIMVSGVSTNGTNSLNFQIGDSGGIEATGYSGTAQAVGGSAFNNTIGFQVPVAAAAATMFGVITLNLMDASLNRWAAFGIFGRNDTALTYYTTGSKDLSGVLTQVRMTAGGDTFDAGQINVTYE